ncbi:hypothetical protein [Frankia sp. QA3]|nr:hypothetical protein [Frankia sp. QA3]
MTENSPSNAEPSPVTVPSKAPGPFRRRLGQFSGSTTRAPTRSGGRPAQR